MTLAWRGRFSVIATSGYTADQNVEYQQDLRRFDLFRVVLAARTNRLVDLQLLIPQVCRAIEEAAPGTVRRVSAYPERRRR